MDTSGPRLTTPDPERQVTFDRQEKVMSMYSDNAKTYIQLSGAALVLTLTFADKILHIPATANIANRWTITVWCCFLITIVAGAFYQFLAVKLLDGLLDWDYDKTWDWLEPGYVYGIMLTAFYAGTIIFTVYAIVSLRHP
jgi:hypothetical protein